MTRPPRSIVGTFAAARPWPRRAVLLVLVLVFGLLALFPERYRSAATLAPSDPSTFGLGGSLSQLGAANSVFGNQAAVEITIRIARSLFVRNQVIDKLDLMRRLKFKDRIAADRWLDGAVTVRSLRGGIVQMETRQREASLADALITAYAQCTRERLAVINRQQTKYKRHVLEQLVEESGERYDRAQAAYDDFRRQTRYSDPQYAIEAIGGRIPVLQAEIKAKEVQLNAARQFATDDNMTVRQIVAEADALRKQLSQQQALDVSQPNSVGRVVRESTHGERLQRELALAKMLYESYNKYLQGTAVEDLTALASLRTIEPPFVDTARQLNLTWPALAVLVLLIAGATEFYELRPPLEARSR